MKPQQGKGPMKNKINQFAKQSKAPMVRKKKVIPPAKKEVMVKGSPQKDLMKPVKVQQQKNTTMKAMPAKKLEQQKNNTMKVMPAKKVEWPKAKNAQATKITAPAMATVKRILPQAKTVKKQNAPQKVVPPMIVKQEVNGDDDDDDAAKNVDSGEEEMVIKKVEEDDDENIADKESSDAEEKADEEQDEDDNDDEHKAVIATGTNDETDEDEEDEDEEQSSQPPKKQMPIKTAKISWKYPLDKIIGIQNLPNNVKLDDLVNIFKSYGIIHTINLEQSVHFAHIAFTEAESAKAALALNGTKMDGKKLSVRLKKEIKVSKAFNSDHAIIVKGNKKFSEDQLREYFASCGNITYMKLFTDLGLPAASISFGEMEAIQNALQLDNTELDGENISVTEKFVQIDLRDGHRTIAVKNKQELDRIPQAKIASIFEECGAIEKIRVLCKKTILAFVIFKNEESVEQALHLNGNTIDGVAIDVSEYETLASKIRTIFVRTPPNIPVELIRTVFSQAGDIANISLHHTTATIKFKDVEGYCRSFLLHGSNMFGQPMFIMPYTNSINQSKWGFQQKRPSNASMGNGQHKKFKPNFPLKVQRKEQRQ